MRAADKSAQSREASASITILVVMISYLILTLPGALLKPLLDYAPGLFEGPRPYETGYNIFFSLKLTWILHTSNSSINFVLYALTGSEFRVALLLNIQYLKAKLGNLFEILQSLGNN